MESCISTPTAIAEYFYVSGFFFVFCIYSNFYFNMTHSLYAWYGKLKGLILQTEFLSLEIRGQFKFELACIIIVNL